jgi:GTP-binding protein HflX
LHGNLRGLSPAEKHRLERLYRRRIPTRLILSNEIARELASISLDLNRRIGMLVDRAGRIEAISVGGAERVEVPRKPSAPSGRMRFCTLRFLATQFGNKPLSSAELAPLALHRLDCMAVIAVDGAEPGPVQVAHLLPAPERRGRARRADPVSRLPRGAITPGRSARRRVPRPEIEDISADGERYRIFPPRPASLIDDDFLDLIRALEREFDRHRERTKVAGQVGGAILVHVATGNRGAGPEASMDELAELALSSDLRVVERIVQRRKTYDPKTLMGSGKLRI